MIGVLGAVALLALGCWPLLRLNKRERPRPPIDRMRQRQIEREERESLQIGWRR